MTVLFSHLHIILPAWIHCLIGDNSVIYMPVFVADSSAKRGNIHGESFFLHFVFLIVPSRICDTHVLMHWIEVNKHWSNQIKCWLRFRFVSIDHILTEHGKLLHFLSSSQIENCIVSQHKISYSTICLNIKHRRRCHPKPSATNNFFKQTYIFHWYRILPRKRRREKCTIWKALSARVVEHTTSIYLSAENILWGKSLYLILNVLNGKCRMCHAIWDRYECLKYFRYSLNKNQLHRDEMVYARQSSYLIKIKW